MRIALAVLLCGAMAVSALGDDDGRLASIDVPTQVVHGEPMTVTASIENVDDPYDEWSFFSYRVVERWWPQLMLDHATWAGLDTLKVNGGASPGVQVLTATIPPERLPSKPGRYAMTLHARIAWSQRTYAFGMEGEPRSGAWEIDYSPRRVYFTITGDFSGPFLRIVSPMATQTVFTNSELTVTGYAGTAEDLVRVDYQLNGGDYISAQQEGTNWSATLNLQPGTNSLVVRAIDAVSNQTVRTRTLQCFMRGPLAVSVNGNGHLGPFTNGQSLVLGREYTIMAVPDAGYVFSHWTGLEGHDRVLSFVMSDGLALEANFIPDPFPEVAGSYFGLYYNPDMPAHESAGQVTLVVARRGAFTGVLQHELNRYPFSGRLDPDLRTEQWVRLWDNSWLILGFDLSTGPGVLAGAVAGDGWSSPLTGFVQTYNARRDPATNYAGTYNVGLITGWFPGTPPTVGHGIARLKVDLAGRAFLTLVEGDGATAFRTVPISRGGDIPLYLPLYSGKGSVVGWLELANASDNEVPGQLLWTKPARPESASYPEGFTNSVTTLGSRYVPPPSGSPALNLTDVTVLFNGGGLEEPLAAAATLSPNTFLIEPPNSDAIVLNVVPSTGTINGSLVHPVLNKIVPVRGVLLQKQNQAYGFFPGPGRTGTLTIQPAAP